MEETSSGVTESECITLTPVKRPDGSIDWTETRTKIQEAYKDHPPDEFGVPAWQTAYNTLYTQEQEREILSRMAEVEQGANLPGLSVPEWTSAFRGSPGFVVDDALARATPCRRINLGEGHRPLVYSKGIIGALDDDQIATYCVQGFIEEAATPAQRARLVALSEAAHLCSIETREAPPEQHLDLYFTCLGKELKQRGMEP